MRHVTDFLLIRDEIPPRTLSSLELFRRSPNFYSYNPNPKKNAQSKKSSSKNLEKSADGRIVNKNNDYDFDNVTVIFKELSHGPQIGKRDTVSSCSNSLEYFLEQLSGINAEDFATRRVDEDADLNGGMQLVSMRTVYTTDE